MSGAGASSPATRLAVVMGVSGSGKTTVAVLLAASLGWHFAEADDFHPPENVAKMHAGTPLTDADRWPWLARIAGQLGEWRSSGARGLVTCSALKRAYRDVLRDGHDDVRFVYLRGTRELIGRRLAARKGHFMPASLLDSQFADLEEPGADERPVVVDVGEAPVALVRRIIPALLAP